MIRRRWLDNQFYGMIFSHIYTHGKWKMVTGGGVNQYKGKHLGEVIWARYSGSSEINHPYYSGVSDKVDMNIYEKINYDVNSKVQVWVDLQARSITYKTNGTNDYSGYIIPYQVSKSYLFFNPKIGMTYHSSSAGVYNFYAGIGNREPVRDDMINSSQRSEPKSEKLYDVELSHAIRFGAVNLQSNVYMMYYQNQLINDGSINDVGAYNRINVPQSYRAGIEVSILYQISKQFNWNFNIGLSQNKILNFKEYIDSYDSAWNYLGNSLNKEYKSVDIAFSPNVVASSILTYKISNNFKIAWIGKYVSSQFLDNTGSEARRIKPYQVNDLQLTYSIKTKFIGLIQVNLLCNNVMNLKYENNGYTYSSVYAKTRIDYNSFYPSAGTNFMLKVTCDF
ncbi:MAG: TonB-dependent receptor [Bacteroidetes bacterium]|nr:TonB-dependent receptor [Bacteroidota bacterium]